MQILSLKERRKMGGRDELRRLRQREEGKTNNILPHPASRAIRIVFRPVQQSRFAKISIIVIRLKNAAEAARAERGSALKLITNESPFPPRFEFNSLVYSKYFVGLFEA